MAMQGTTILGGHHGLPPEQTTNYGAAIATLGLGLQLSGVVSGAIGAYYQTKALAHRARSQASRMEFEESMSNIMARNAERAAAATELAGQREAGRAGQRYRQLRASIDARRGARGVQQGVGSEAEIAASIELAKETDQLAITRNAVRAANNYRTQATAARNRAGFAATNARNALDYRDQLSPGFAAGTTILGGMGGVARSAYLLNRSL